MENNLYKYRTTIKKIIDGDSLVIDIDLGFNVILRDQKIRLYGINTPEISGVERSQGLIAKVRVKQLIEGKDVILESYKDKTEKYGRWLGIIHYSPDGGNELTNLNEQLVSEGLVERYIL